LNAWQGQWCFELLGGDHGFRDSARDRTNPDKTLLLLGTLDGIVSEMSYPTDRRYYDTDLSNNQNPIESSLISRSFTFTADPMQAMGYTSQTGLNQIQPHSSRLQFLDSVDDVDITVILDRASEPLILSTPTSGALLQLTIPALPFDLDTIGYYYYPISLMSVGVCAEIQIELEGSGNWTLFQLKVAAWEAAPLMAT
jgi:hypothetical protein